MSSAAWAIGVYLFCKIRPDESCHGLTAFESQNRQTVTQQIVPASLAACRASLSCTPRNELSIGHP
ncbi:hypothetical protein CITRIK5_20252 [Citricoccus sp. K5]|nr:hypothetical protein CITRIK5_20252 [Citricoccus sp. K5]